LTDEARGVLRLQDVCRYLGRSKSTIWRWMRERGFPHPTHPGLGFWTREQIDRWIRNEREVEAAPAVIENIPPAPEIEPAPVAVQEEVETKGAARPEALVLRHLRRGGRGRG
jgi:predicted DNA-binding transcriptional regulator AlpA